MAARNDWTEEQITIVLYEYCRKPFGQFSARKSFVQELGTLIGRSPAAIVRKVGNLASFDPQMRARGVNGLGHAAKNDGIVWNRYYNHWDQLAYDAEVLLARLKNQELIDSVTIDTSNLPAGEERIREIKTRVNQDFFRHAVLTSYNNQCCITGMNNPLLLNACHIVDWAEDEQNRTNPENGLSMNVLFHKAYDENLIGISPDYEIFISDEFLGTKLNDVGESTKEYIKGFDHKHIVLPNRFCPNKELLEIHYDKYRRKIG